MYSTATGSMRCRPSWGSAIASLWARSWVIRPKNSSCGRKLAVGMFCWRVRAVRSGRLQRGTEPLPFLACLGFARDSYLDRLPRKVRCRVHVCRTFEDGRGALAADDGDGELAAAPARPGRARHDYSRTSGGFFRSFERPRIGGTDTRFKHAESSQSGLRGGAAARDSLVDDEDANVPFS